MAEEIKGQVLSSMPIGYALHKIIVDDDGYPCDYEYIEANIAFEEATGLLSADIIGKRVTQILPDIKKDEFDWIKAYGKVALNGEHIDFEQYSCALKKWYKVSAFSPKHGYFATLVNDITKEKEENKNLGESNKLLTDFLDSSSDMIFLKDEQLRHVYANQALADFLGKQPLEVLGKDDFELYPAAMAERCRETDLDVMKASSKIIIEETIFDKTFETIKFPVFYPDGTSGVGAFIKEITDLKNHEDSLKRQIYRQNILVDVFMKNFQTERELLDYALNKALELTGSQYGNIYLYNEETCEFTLSSWPIGVMKDCEMFDKNANHKLDNFSIWSEVVNQRKPIVINDMAKSADLKKGYPKVHVNLRNFLSVPIIVDEKIVAVAGLGNKSMGYTDIDINDTIILLQSAWLAMEKKRAQIQTVKEREKYQSILNELPAFICEYLPDSTLTFANREYCSYFGLSKNSVCEKKLLDFIPKKERELAIQRILNLTPFNRTNDYEFKVKVKGELRWHSWRDIGIFDSQGSPLRYYSIGFDITERKSSQEEMEHLLARMDAMFNEHEAVMLLIDPASGQILDANPSASIFYGYTKQELLSMNIDEINQLSKEEIAEKRLLIANKEQKYFTFPHKLKNGLTRIVDVYSSPISYNGSTALFSIIFDVTKREDAFREIDNKQALLSSLINSTPDLIFYKSTESIYLGCNKAFEEFTGKPAEEIVGQTDFDLFDADLANKYRRLDTEVLESKQPMRSEELNRNTKGIKINFDTLKSPYFDVNGNLVGLIGISRDITERKIREEEVVYISYHDYLTGAYNRRFFEEEFERQNTALNFPIAVIMGDVNGLKLINDSFGHHFGDKLLIEVVKRISKCLRPSDVSARIGGDEFGIILPRTSEDEANAIVSQIKQSLETDAENSLLSVSFGFAIQSEAGVELGVLMKEAEGYMYRKKFYDSRSLKGKTINIVMKTLFEKSPREKMHSERVGNISAAIAEKLGFENERVNKIRVAGCLHDIGKIGIPENILNKNGKLNSQEWEIMKTHSVKSGRILENTIEYSEISDIVLYHHEKWNGSGYPKGLAGEEIPLESRIIAVADAYDAMTFNRTYRSKISSAEAIKALKKGAGTQFDPAMVEIFIDKVLADEKDFLSRNGTPTNWNKI